MLEFLVVGEFSLNHHFTPQGEHAFSELGVGFVGFFSGEFNIGGGLEELVAADHHSVGEVEGGVERAGGDVNDVGAERQFFVKEAFVFATEKECDAVVSRAFEGRGRKFGGREGRVAVEAGAGGGAGDERTVGNRCFECVERFSGGELGAGVAGELFGFVPIGIGTGIDNG